VIIVVVPVFNETGSVDEFCSTLEQSMGDTPYMAIFVDDGSTDGTREKLRMKPKVRLLERSERGFGSAVMTGIRTAAEFNPEYIASIDGDMQQSPDNIVKMLQARITNKADYVVGSKWKSSTNFTLMRRLASRVAGGIAHRLLKINVRDVTSNVRCYSPVAYQRLIMAAYQNKYPTDYSFQLWSLFQLRQLKSAQIDYTFYPRKAGASKFRWSQGFKYLKTATKLLFDA
jgi:glycosyltransferase involved in cell wall biosynthesis